MDDFKDSAEPTIVEVEIEVKPPITLDQAKRKFTTYIDATSDDNTLAIRDRQYYDGEQLTQEIKQLLIRRGQPRFVNNKIAPAVMGILGIIDAGDSDPEAFPRNPQGQDAADVATKLLRYVADACHLPETMNGISKDFLIEGTGAAIVHGDDDKAWVEYISWDDFFHDPLSRRHDFKDARYLGIAKWLDVDVVRALFPVAYEKLGNPVDDSSFFLDAKEIEARRHWIDAQRKQLRVVDMYFLDEDGTWQRLVFCHAGFLHFGPSEYEDDEGNSICPIEAASFEIDRDTGRYGVVRNMVAIQDQINAFQSRALHLVNHRQVRQTDQAGDQNREIARAEASKADGAIPFGWDVVQTTDLTAGQFSMLQQALADMDRLAPTPAVLGRTSGSNESGRARQILQQAGYTELARAIGRYEALEVRIYRQIWFRIRQFFTNERIVPITGDARSIEFIKINEPLLGNPPVRPQLVAGPDGQPMMDQSGQPLVEVVPNIVGMNNRVAEMDMDIVVSRVPDTLTLQQETFAEVLKLAASAQMDLYDPRFRTLVKVSGLPNARQLAEQLEADAGEAAQAQAAQAELAQQMAGIDAQTKQAKAAKDLASADKATAEAEQTRLETGASLIQDSMIADPYGQQRLPGF